jgi:imidazolonepropionase
VFAGDRSNEFEARCQGKSYLAIAQAGGGIVKTVSATRAASEAELISLALPRLQRLLTHGVTTAEVKSGYGLTIEDEMKMLRVIRALGTRQSIELKATLLALHTIPTEYKEHRGDYLRLVNEQLLPRVAKESLAETVDAFVESSAFTHEEAAEHLELAKKLGFKIRMHVDQLTPNGGAQLAAKLKSVTADHLEQISANGIAALKSSGTIAVLAPTSTLFAKARPFAPGRALCDAGIKVALCTNVNPGSSHSENVFLAMGLACVENGLTPAEALLGFTAHGADAISRPDLGRITVGSQADLTIFHADSYRSIPYCFGMNQVGTVIKRGTVVHSVG